jgi:two-component system sensor histidine kinase/response regulator
LKGDRERCLEAGMDDYVSKPIQPQALLGTLDRCLQLKDKPNTQPLPALDEMDYSSSPDAIAASRLSIERDMFGEQAPPVEKPVSAVLPFVPSSFEEAAPMDVDSAMPRFYNDRTFFSEMCRDFIAHMPERLVEFDTALKAGDVPALFHLAHSLKGTSATFSAAALSSTCAELELQTRDGEASNAAQLVERIHAEAGHLLDFMRRECLK